MSFSTPTSTRQLTTVESDQQQQLHHLLPPPDHQETAACPDGTSVESLQLSQSIGEDLKPRLQRRNQFIFARKTALSMDQCPVVWSQSSPSPSPSVAMHAHSGSDTGLLLATAAAAARAAAQQQQQQHRSAGDPLSAQKRRSVTESPHLRVLHDSLTSLTSRITGGGGSQENLPGGDLLAHQHNSSGTASPTYSLAQFLQHPHLLQQQQQPGFVGKANRSRRKMKDSRDKLSDSLKLCEVNGLPRPENQQQLESLCLDLESSWDKVVTDRSTTSSKTVKQQAAIWELLQTEINILRHLKTILEVYVAVIKHLQASCGLLTDVSTELLFPGIAEVFQAHYTLWTGHLRPALLAARRSGARLRPTEFYRGFAEFRGVFQPSAEFCMRIAEAKEYLKGLEKNESFNDFVRWAQKISQRNYSLEDGAVDLQLASLLTMPLQRLMKYGLLLQEILRHTEDDEERLALDTMIGHVTAFCNQLNATYRSKCDLADLRGVAERIEDPKLHEWMDSLGEETASFLESYRFDLTRPMPHNGESRRKLAEGDLRCKDEKGKWSEARCLLFTDLLLLAKSSKRSSLRLVRPPLRLDRLAVHKLGDNSAFLLVAQTDFGSVDALLCLAGDSPKATDEWIDRIGQAKAALQQQLCRDRVTQEAAAAGGMNHHNSCDSGAAREPQPASEEQHQVIRLRQQDHQRLSLISTASSSGSCSDLVVVDGRQQLQQQNRHTLQHDLCTVAVSSSLTMTTRDESCLSLPTVGAPAAAECEQAVEHHASAVECNRRSSHV